MLLSKAAYLGFKVYILLLREFLGSETQDLDIANAMLYCSTITYGTFY